jgi:hypothetical protein
MPFLLKILFHIIVSFVLVRELFQPKKTNIYKQYLDLQGMFIFDQHFNILSSEHAGRTTINEQKKPQYSQQPKRGKKWLSTDIYHVYASNAPAL